MIRQKFSVLALLCTFLTQQAPAVQAQPYPTIDTSQAMSFGTFAVRNNTAQHMIVIDPITGNGTYDAALLEIDPVQRGIYVMEGLPPNTPITLIFTNATLTPSGPGPSFSVSDFTDNSPVSDAAGDATFLVGATLRTSGNGQHYNSDSYSGTFDLQIAY
ncbi:MAG: DUF4402 domain-containing protein [Micavibrio aeruginosavorus]|nr:DUF4402 domain-containing protein [Micavibrio aeruginosavorus]